MDSSHTPPRPRGTAFVCFWARESADAVLSLAAQLRSISTGVLSTPVPSHNPFKMGGASLLMPDPSASASKGLVLNGRTLDVVRAVERGEAGRLEEEGVKKRRKEDKRNLYLIKEGGWYS
jgi:nucleolar protein 4